VFFVPFGFGTERKIATPDVYAGVVISNVVRFIFTFFRVRAIMGVDV
jgi:hypothetical protein